MHNKFSAKIGNFFGFRRGLCEIFFVILQREKDNNNIGVGIVDFCCYRTEVHGEWVCCG